MATFKDGINGPFKGKVGSVIGSSWRKVNYMKGLPRKKKRTPSPEQALQRKKFALFNHFLDPLSSLLEIGFGTSAGRATGRNAAFSYNYDHAFHIVEGEVKLNYPALRFSHGSLFPAGDERAWIAGDTVHVSWNPDTYGMGGGPDDEACVILYEEIRGFFHPVESVFRQDGSAHIVDSAWASNPIKPHLWLFFIDKLRKQVSKTVYIPITSEA